MRLNKNFTCDFKKRQKDVDEAKGIEEGTYVKPGSISSDPVSTYFKGVLQEYASLAVCGPAQWVKTAPGQLMRVAFLKKPGSEFGPDRIWIASITRGRQI